MLARAAEPNHVDSTKYPPTKLLEFGIRPGARETARRARAPPFAYTYVCREPRRGLRRGRKTEGGRERGREQERASNRSDCTSRPNQDRRARARDLGSSGKRCDDWRAAPVLSPSRSLPLSLAPAPRITILFSGKATLGGVIGRIPVIVAPQPLASSPPQRQSAPRLSSSLTPRAPPACLLLPCRRPSRRRPRHLTLHACKSSLPSCRGSALQSN